MVAQAGERKRSNNAGELSPDLAEAVDIKQFYAGGLRYKNVEPVAQAGFDQMAGSRDLGPVRKRLSALSQSSISSSLGPHTGTQTVWSATIAGTVAGVHIEAAAGGTALAAHTLTCEVNTGAGWVQIGPAITLSGTAAKTRSFAAAPGAGLVGTAVRLRCVFSTSDTLTLGAKTVLAEGSDQDVPRMTSLRHDSGDHYRLALTEKWLDIWQDDTWRAGVWLPTVTASLQAEAKFYTENATIGIFSRDLETIRVRRSGSATEWEVDSWPYAGVPGVDYGATYSKTDDVWEIFVSWTDNDDYLYLSVTVNGETTPSVPLQDGAGDPVTFTAASSTPAYWDNLTAALKTALEALPSLGPTITIAWKDQPGKARKLIVTFEGDLSGDEYQVTALATNTADVAAIAYHIEIGETAFEPLISTLRGWPGNVCLVQDRMAYLDLNGQPSAVALSQGAEYFNLNIEAAGASAARLDRLRAGSTIERVIAGLDATYFVIFTNRGVYFVANRVLTAGEPLNFTAAGEKGIAPDTTPIAAAGKVYYVALNIDQDGETIGHQVMSLRYDEIATNFVADPESLLATHLIENVTRTALQLSDSHNDANRLWFLRSDGRLICGLTIPSQDILGFCEWVAAAGGAARQLHVEERNRMWIVVERDNEKRYELMDRAIFLQAAVSATADLAGEVDGLDLHEGREVWAVAENYVLGPFTVDGGAIDLGDAYTGDVLVGLWQPPVWESMPRWRILPDDSILKRPGRIHGALVSVKATTSIAIGANGQPVRDVPLLDTNDPTNAPMPAKTKTVQRFGMMGMQTGTTMTISQVRPGTLRVTSIVYQEKL